MCVRLRDGAVVPMVFGGEQSGEIALLYSSQSRLIMPSPCPAHDSPVVKIIGSSDTVHLTEENSSSCALVSYGANKLLHVWSMHVDEDTDIVTLSMKHTIHLESSPGFMCLLHSNLCVSLEKALIVVPLLQNGQDSPFLPSTIRSFYDLSLLTHQKEDEHKGAVLSLTCSVELGLFASSGTDGMVKVWSVSNQLVSEIEFGESLRSICFSNSRGDLLVGFQKHVCVVKAEDYLTSDYVSNDRGLRLNEQEAEKPIPFDYDLEFWLVRFS